MLAKRKEMERSTKKAGIANALYTYNIMIGSWWEFHLMCQNANIGLVLVFTGKWQG